MKKTVRILLIAILACVFLFCAYKLVSVTLEYRRAEELYDAEREAVFHVAEPEPDAAPTASPQPSGEEPDAPEQPPEEEYFPEVKVDFEALTAENPDVIGWLWLPDTDISYPLMRGVDNQKYLHQTYNGDYNASGSIFTDCRCADDLSGQNTVIYGHNMKNGAMFGRLDEFASQDYFDAHQYAYIFTPERAYKYRVFSAYVTTVDGRGYAFAFEDGAEMEDYIAYARQSSEVTSELAPTAEDRLIMLSTCTSRTVRERFVVHAVLTAVREEN